jgi:hypothetical protein
MYDTELGGGTAKAFWMWLKEYSCRWQNSNLVIQTTASLLTELSQPNVKGMTNTINKRLE